MFYDQLKKACKNNGTTVTAVLKKIGIGTANGTYWKNGSVPSADIVVQLSEFLGVSTDYLLKGKENESLINVHGSNIGAVADKINGTISVGDIGNRDDSYNDKKESSDSCIKGLDGEALKIFHRLPLKEQYRLLAVMCDFEEEYLKKLNEWYIHTV